MPFTFLFSASKRFIPFLSNATRCLFTFKTSEIGCFRPFYFEMLAFWASALSCLWILNFPGLAIYYIPALNPNWLAWLFQVPIPKLLSSSATPFLSLKADGIHSFLVHSGSSNTFSELIFTACFFFALPKHISFLKWVVRVQFRNDFSIATSPRNSSIFGIFDSNTFHTHHTSGLCCSGVRFQVYLYWKTWTQNISNIVFHLLLEQCTVSSPTKIQYFLPFSTPQLARLSCRQLQIIIIIQICSWLVASGRDITGYQFSNLR